MRTPVNDPASSWRGQLLERDDALADLGSALARVRAGRGEVAIVRGEAGVGKTSLVRQFASHAVGRPLVLWGGCDPLSAPRPLGPLIDAAEQVAPEIVERLGQGAGRAEAFGVAMGLLRDADRPVVFVVEDAHWADDATLDMLTYLGRRIDRVPALVVVTYRDDDVAGSDRLRLRFGELGRAIWCRVHLRPLSIEAVRAMVHDAGIDPVGLYEMTGGNPFFVTEVLGADPTSAPPGLPQSLSDAVLARAARLSPGARSLLDGASVVPGRAERPLLEALLAGDGFDDGLRECLHAGLLREHVGDVEFRHELARLVVEAALDAASRRTYHERALDALRARPTVDAARAALHAAGAGDRTAVLEYAPEAARRAVAVGSNREAASHLEAVLRHGDTIDPLERADFWLRLAAQRSILGQPHEALDAFDRAEEIGDVVGDIELRAMARVGARGALVQLARQDDAVARVASAHRMLAGRPPSRAAATVSCAVLSNLMLARQADDADRAGRQAVELAEQVGEPDLIAEAWIQSGIARAMAGDDDGLAMVRRGIDLAAETRSDDLVALGLMQIGSGFGELRRYDVALPALAEGLEFAEDRELVSAAHYLRAWSARCELELGRWEVAGRFATGLIADPRCVGVSRFVALVTAGWLRARRGDPDVAPLLDEALELADATGHVQRLWPVAACRAEWAWLRNCSEEERPLLQRALSLAERVGYAPAIAELRVWIEVFDGDADGPPPPPRADRLDRPDVSGDRANPFEMLLDGDAGGAAEAWSEIGCPYEEAMAMFFTDETEQIKAAHVRFVDLGASPMAQRTAAVLRSRGASVPRGHNASTLADPYGLTRRQREVIALLVEGSTDREIASRLHISVKTAGHHVSNVLDKLGVRSRGEAAVLAERESLAP